jgi:hypothetical protein
MTNALTPTMTALTPTSMDAAIQLAEMMARGKLVPEHLQGSPGDCLMVIEQAMRWGMSPFAVAQATGVVKGKMSYEGKLVAAAIHTSGVLNGRLRYDFTGEGAARKVVASGQLKGEDRARTVEVALASARTTNEHWIKSPDQMLTYHAARVWARRHTPEVMLGVYAPEEFEQQSDAAPFTGTTIDAELPAPPTRPDAKAFAPPAPPSEDPRYADPAKRAAWLVKMRDALATCRTEVEVEKIAAGKPVLDFLDWTRTHAPADANEVDALLVEASRHVAKMASAAGDEWIDADTGEIHIKGEEKMGAG